MTTIGVLAIQGDFLEHQKMLHLLDVETIEIRLPHELDNIDGLIIPGGESTTITQLIDIYGFRWPLTEKARSKMPIWGTCAGMIVIANRLSDHRPEPLHILDIGVSRNAFGRQADSFETNLEIKQIQGPPFHAIFIRAPIVNAGGRNVTALASINGNGPVAVRQEHLLATSFHPELTNDSRIHKLFAGIVKDYT